MGACHVLKADERAPGMAEVFGARSAYLYDSDFSQESKDAYAPRPLQLNGVLTAHDTVERDHKSVNRTLNFKGDILAGLTPSESMPGFDYQVPQVAPVRSSQSKISQLLASADTKVASTTVENDEGKPTIEVWDLKDFDIQTRPRAKHATKPEDVKQAGEEINENQTEQQKSFRMK